MSSAGHLSELDLLRGQVADLSRQLAERDRLAHDMQEHSDLLRAIVEDTAAETGEEFLASLVTHLTMRLKVQYAVIGEVQGDRIKKIRTLAVSAGGALADNFEYDLDHTPCAIALTQTFAYFNRDLQATFPEYQRLVDLGAESYCAVPVRTNDGAVRGLLVVMDTKPLENSDYLQSLLGVFAPRIAAEFERRRAEQERAQALADLHNVIETIPDIVFALNTQGNLVKWNRRLEDVTGYNHEELLNMPALAFVPPEEHIPTAAAIQRAFTEGYAELEGHLLTREHRLIPYHWAGAVLKNLQGEPIGITGIGRDVSAKRRAEEALHRSEQRFALAVEGSTDILWDAHRLPGEPWYAPQTSIWWSPRVRELLGLQESDSFETFEQWIARLHSDDKDRVFGQLAAHIEQRVPYDVEYRLRTNAGDYRWIRGRGQALWDEQGEPCRMSGSCQDITDRKRAEEALHASEERFTLAVRGSNTGIWDWDLRTGRIYFSPLWKSMLGYEEHELRGELFEWEERLHPDDRERSSATVRVYLEGTTPQYELEHRLRHKDGSYRWILARGVSICDTGGNPYRMAGSHIDITEQKQTQEALAQSECQLRTVLDALPVGVWFTDQSGKPLLVNPAAKQIWSNIKQIGLQTENHQGGWWETIGPAIEPHRWALSHVLTTGIPSLNETFDFECFDGTKKTIRNSTVPVKSEAGVTLGAIVLNEDITLLRQAQAALQLTQFSVDHAVEGFLWIGPDARIFHVNDSTCRMLEYTWEELTTMTLHDIDPNLSSDVWPAHWEELKEKGSLTFESKYWSRTGRVLDMEVTVNYLQYEGKEYNCAIMRDIGERKRAEAALRASEERYRVLYDDTPMMYFTLSTDGRVLSVNRFGAEQLGYRVEELVGHSVLSIVYAEDKETVTAGLSECLTTPETVRHWEFRKVRKDGSVIWVRETVHVGQSSSGETIVLVTCEDITERKRAETRLRRTQFAVDHATDYIFVIGSNGYFLDVNESACRRLGYTKEEVLTMSVMDIDPDFPQAIWESFWEEFKRKKLLRLETRHCSKSGEIYPVEVVANYILHEGKELDYAFVRDISERKRVEEELQKSHAFLRQVIDIDPNFIFAKDREGRFTLVNKAVADAYGTTVDKLVGKTDADFNPNQEEVAFFRQKDLTVMDTLQELFLREEVITDSGGRNRWLQTVKRPILDNEGRATMVLGASTDITERKRIEETLRQQERALRAAIEEREQISQDLHDGILQSLFAVGLALESAKLTMAPRNLKTSRASLNQAIDQLNDVMREIRNFIAGLGSDLLQGKSFPVVLKQVLASLTEHQATRVRLAVEDRAAKAVSTEQSLHLLRVIQEAVSNCIRHGHAQEARVSLKLLKQGVRLSIRDNGRGFNQDAAKGTGHGLANMAARAQKIGGRFTILSKVNEGTSIVLDLPNEAANVSR